MVAADDIEISSTNSNKRKRDSSSKPSKRTKLLLKSICDDLLLLISSDRSARKSLDHTDETQPRSIRERLESRAYDNVEEVLRHSETTRDSLLQHQTDAGEVSLIMAFHDKIASLLNATQREKAISEAKDPAADDEAAVSETSLGFPSRQSEGRTLFASTVVGPLFASTAKTLPDSLVADLPPNVHSIRVLPTAPGDARGLEDMYQEPQQVSSNDVLQSGRQPIFTSKVVRRGIFESFGLDTDAQGAVFDRETANMCQMHSRRRVPDSSSLELITAQREDNTSILAVDGENDSEEFQFDEDLLETFDSEEDRANDVSAMLLELADMQHARIADGPFSSPSDEEEALATKITQKLSTTITDNDIRPKQLMTEEVSFTFPRFDKTYNGTLPPTIAQAVRATYAHTVPLQSHPLSRTRSQHYPKYTLATKSQSTPSASALTTNTATPVPS